MKRNGMRGGVWYEDTWILPRMRWRLEWLRTWGELRAWSSGTTAALECKQRHGRPVDGRIIENQVLDSDSVSFRLLVIEQSRVLLNEISCRQTEWLKPVFTEAASQRHSLRSLRTLVP